MRLLLPANCFYYSIDISSKALQKTSVQFLSLINTSSCIYTNIIEFIKIPNHAARFSGQKSTKIIACKGKVRFCEPYQSHEKEMNEEDENGSK